MFPSLCQAHLFCIKVALSVTVLYLILSPTRIYRNIEDSVETDYIDVHARHLFCDLPVTHNDSVPYDQLLNMLKLPQGSKVSNELSNYGQCLYSMKLSGASFDPCYCHKHSAYVAIVFTTSIFLTAEIVRYLIWCLRTLKSANSATDHGVCLQFFGCIFWPVVICWAIVYHTNWSDFVALKDSLHARSYFAKPFKWSFAIGLSILVWFSCVCEYIHLLKCGPAATGTKGENGQKRDATLVTTDQDKWSTEPYPEHVQERLHKWEHHAVVGSKSWP